MYYPSALRLAPTHSQPLVDLNPVPPSPSNQLAPTPFDVLDKDKELEQPPPVEVVVVETEEVTEVAQLKRKKKKKKQEKKGGKGRRLQLS